MKTERDLSYYALRLRELLHHSFPERIFDEKFIDERSSWAAEAFVESFRAGNRIPVCEEIALQILFAGLHFSRFDTLYKVVCNEFDTLMPDEELRPFALQMMPITDPVFAEYPLSDDFANSSAYELLYTELTGAVALYIDAHGLQ